MNRIFASLFVSALLMSLGISCRNDLTGFAIVVDSESYRNASEEIDAYSRILETEGLQTNLLVKDYPSPDSLRADLLAFSRAEVPIEGAVFIGDIPIPFVVDAQHMTSAFKMDQKRFGIERASVPSDRYYDDFDLVFDFIKRDSVNRQRFYYSLNYQSSQTIQPDIYSGRIKMPEVANKYELLRSYLRKVVKEHQAVNQLDQFFFFSGHGYNSESLEARLDEELALSRQLPGNPSIKFMDSRRTTFVKFPYMRELQRDELDVALLHHHGGVETEYLSGWPQTDSYMEQINLIKRFMRGRMRSAVPKGVGEMTEVKRFYNEKYDLPGSWFENATDSETMVNDSTWSADLDLVLQDFDIYGYQPDVRFAIFDACYNGSFHQEEYLSGAYLAAPGRTVVAQGNTVNSIQDKWPQEMIGLLSLGMRVGEWNKMVCYLETHILGDPTFRFTSVDPSVDVQKMVVSESANKKQWLGLLDSKYPDVQALGLRKLYQNGYDKLSDLLLETYQSSDFGSVRMECLKLSARLNDENFIELLKSALEDDYELVQRFAVDFAGQSGNPALIPNLVKLGFSHMSERVEFNYKEAIGFFDAQKLMAEYKKQIPEVSFLLHSDPILPQLQEAFEQANKQFLREMGTLTSSSSSEKEKILTIRNLRNYNYHMGVPAFIKFIDESENLAARQMMIEALGWFRLSYEKQQIIDFCSALARDESVPGAIREEAVKTVLRLS